MLQQILKLIKALLSSLYMLFEGIPALEHLRSWFGGEGEGGVRASALLMVGLAVLLGSAAFLILLWVLRRREARPRVSPLGAFPADQEKGAHP